VATEHLLFLTLNNDKKRTKQTKNKKQKTKTLATYKTSYILNRCASIAEGRGDKAQQT